MVRPKQLLALFEGEAATNNNRMIMDAFSKMDGSFSDPVLLNNLMHVARQLHDSLDYLSFDDERRQLGLLITAFVRKMSFGKKNQGEGKARARARAPQAPSSET